MDESAEAVPHLEHVAGVGVAVEAGGGGARGLDLVEGKAAAGEVVGDIVGDPVEFGVGVFDEFLDLAGLHAGDFGDDGGDEDRAGAGVEGEGAEPMGLEEGVDRVSVFEATLGGDDGGFFDEVSVGQVDGDFVASPVAGLDDKFGVAPGPVGGFVVVGWVGGGGGLGVEDDD